jgi:hypothetical protein
MAQIDQTGRPWGGRSLPQMRGAGNRGAVGIGGWLLIYVIGRVGLLLHQLQLTVGAIVIFADPTVAGLRTFVPLGSLLFYEATNWLLVGFTIAALVLIRRRTPAAIPVNLALSGLWLAALIVWQFLGLKSPAGTVIDAIPALFGLWYFASSRRVRNTFTRTGDRGPQERTS